MAAPLAGREAGRGGRRARRKPMSEINVTPFVDVMLVLLIIFMVAAPLLTVGVPMTLPETRADALPTPEEPPLTVQLSADGRVFLMDAEVPPDALIARLTAIGGERRGDQVYLRADRALDYGRVMEVMGALQAGGFRRIALVTDPLPAGAEGRP